MLKPMSPGLSPAVQSLGLGDLLNQQVKGETDEERKRRMKEMQDQSLTGSAASSLGLTGGMSGY